MLDTNIGVRQVKKFCKRKNIRFKSVNNQTNRHRKTDIWHTISKDIKSIYESLRPIYEELDRDFQTVDVVDLIYYERWLNE